MMLIINTWIVFLNYKNISLKENGHDLTKYSSLYITDGLKTKKIHRKPRIGISRGLDKKWNFSIDISDYF